MKHQGTVLVQGFVFLLALLLGNLPVFADSKGMPFILNYERRTLDSPPQLELLRYAFQQGLTLLQGNYATLYIDYAHLNLYRYEKDSDRCVRFPLHDPAAPPADQVKGSEILTRKIFEIGKVKVNREARKRENIQGYSCQQNIVVFGPDIQRLRTMVTPTVEQYGQSFQPVIAKVWATASLEGMDDLVYLAHTYEPVFQANPLLRQLDPLGLLLKLQGVPIRSRHSRGQETLKEARWGQEGEVIVLPSACQSP